MGIKDQLDTDLKTAMKSRDKLRTTTLRGLKSAIKYAEIEVGDDLDDKGLIGVIAKQAKQRRDSIAAFQKANRVDLVEKEEAELAILEQYLPVQMSEDKIGEKAQVVIIELGVTDMKGAGQVMKQLMAELKGQADGKAVQAALRDL